MKRANEAISFIPSAIVLSRLDSNALIHFGGVGNTELLDLPPLGVIASRECPGHLFLETLVRVPQWVQAGRVIVSGFHSSLEQQVLRSVLRRKGQVVKMLARGMLDYRPEPEETQPSAAGRMLVITACPPTHRDALHPCHSAGAQPVGARSGH